MRIKLGIAMRLDEIADAVSGRKINNKNPLICYVSTDTRELMAGDLFIALKGKNHDGNIFVSKAKSKGAYVLSSMPSGDILHPDCRSALLSFAYFYNKNLPIILYRVGITGSVGKTTTKEFLKILLEGSYKLHISEGNFNNQIGLPMSILSADRDCQIMIMEMGMNHLGEIARMSKCLCPNIAIITNIGTAHIGNLGSRETIAKAKMEISDGMSNGVIFIPDGEPLLKNMEKTELFSTDNPNTNYYLHSEKNGCVELYMNNALYTASIFSLTEPHHLKCLAAAVSVAMKIGIPQKELSEKISLISSDNTRQKMFLKENYHFIADCYNASRESVLALIDSAVNSDITADKHLLLGDILELGEMSEGIHYEIGRAVSSVAFASIILFGNEVENIKSGAINNGFPAERIFVVSDLSKPQLCADIIRMVCKSGDHIFMKASRAVGLERVLDYLNE